MARETWVQSQVESYQRLKKWNLIPPCLTVSIIRYGSRVKWSNPGNGVAPSPTPWCSSYRKGSLRVTLGSLTLITLYIPLHRLKDAHVYTHVHICSYTHKKRHANTHTHTHTHTHIYIYIYIYIYTNNLTCIDKTFMEIFNIHTAHLTPYFTIV